MQKKVAEVVKEILSYLPRIPSKFTEPLKKSMHEFIRVLENHPELIEKSIPILIRILQDAKNGNIDDAFKNLVLLLILIKCQLRNNKKHS